MAGDWIPMRLDLCDDPAVLEMADITNQPEEYIVGCLHRIWSWASRNCHDGTVTGVTKMSLSRAVRLPEVVSAMVQVGWLIEGKTEDDRPFVSFPKWENWLSKSAKARLNNAINQRNSRANKESAGKEDPKKPVAAVTTVSPHGSDKPVTTEEKSTGDKDNPPLPPNGGGGTVPEKPEDPPPSKPKRKPKETIGEFDVPPRLDTPEVRQALADFETMRLRTGKRIKDRGNLCRGWDRRFVDAAHLLACIECAISNEYQGISPDYVTAAQSAPVSKPSIWDRVKKY